MIELNKKQKEALLGHITEDYEFGKNERERNSRSTNWKNYRDQYDSTWTELTKKQDDEDLDQWLYVPKTYQHIQRIECALTQNFFGASTNKLAKIYSESNDPGIRLAAAILADIFHQKIDNELQSYRPCRDTWHTALVDDMGVYKAGWIVSGKKTYATGQFVPNDHIVFDPYALTPADVTWVIHEIWLSEEELLARQKVGLYQNVKEIIGANDATQDEWRSEIATPGNRVRVLYKLLEYWGPQYFIDDAEIEKQHKSGKAVLGRNILATVYADKTVLRVEDNVYADLYENPTAFEKLPFFFCNPLPKANSVRGDSMAWRLRPIQRETNWMRNQRRLAVEAEMTGKVVVDTTKITDIKALKKAHYLGIVTSNGPVGDAIKQFTPVTSTGNFAQEEMVLERDATNVSGVTPPHLGENPQGIDTATGMQILTSEGNVKLDTLVRNVAQSLILPLCRFYAACCVRYVMNKPKEMQKILHAQTPPPALDELLGRDYVIEVEAGATATAKATELRNVQYALTAQSQIAQVLPDYALPAIKKLNNKMMSLLGLGDVIPEEGLSAPGRSMAFPNMQNEQAMVQQGRSPTLQESPLAGQR